MQVKSLKIQKALLLTIVGVLFYIITLVIFLDLSSLLKAYLLLEGNKYGDLSFSNIDTSLLGDVSLTDLNFNFTVERDRNLHTNHVKITNIEGDINTFSYLISKDIAGTINASIIQFSYLPFAGDMNSITTNFNLQYVESETIPYTGSINIQAENIFLEYLTEIILLGKLKPLLGDLEFQLLLENNTLTCKKCKFTSHLTYINIQGNIKKNRIWNLDLTLDIYLSKIFKEEYQDIIVILNNLQKISDDDKIILKLSGNIKSPSMELKSIQEQ